MFSQKIEREYFLNHNAINFHFAQNSKDFIVDEVPLYSWSGEGEHLVLKIRKRELTTWEMIAIVSKILGVPRRDIGFAGLKDKHGMTMQFISIPRKFEKEFSKLDNEKSLKILEKHYHKNKIKLGHLKGNKFFIRLKKVNPATATIISEAVKNIDKFGIPNFFGYQRFGIDKKNYLIGKEIIEGKTNLRDKNKKRLFVSAYQSFIFNNWLSKRIQFSRLIDNFSEEELPQVFKNLNLKLKYPQFLKSQKHPFKILVGENMLHYPFGKGFEVLPDEVEEAVKRFEERDSVPSGILIGKKARTSKEDAFLFEEPILEDIQLVNGERRYAWVFPKDLEGKYREKDFWFELNFFLPKGSYATTLLEEIAKHPLN